MTPLPIGGELHSEPGGCSLAFDCDEHDRERKQRPDPVPDNDPEASSPSTPGPRRQRGRTVSPGLGHALREAYQEALSEDVPPEMLDLLGKLG